jgi:tight adherence protein B
MGLIIGLLSAIGIILAWGAIREPMKPRKFKKTGNQKLLAKTKKVPAELWPDVVDDLASAIRAGLSLPQATGDFNAGLNLIAKNLEDPQADKFVASLQIAHEVGGADLGVLLRTLSEVMREELVLRGEIVARQSWTINGAKLAVAAPWVTALVLSTRDSAANVYMSASGIRMLVICAVVSVLAYLAMMKIAELPTEKRLLA